MYVCMYVGIGWFDSQSIKGDQIHLLHLRPGEAGVCVVGPGSKRALDEHVYVCAGDRRPGSDFRGVQVRKGNLQWLVRVPCMYVWKCLYEY